MTWICSFGVVNCPICLRARETIKAMTPNIPDKVIDKTIKDQKIDLHQQIENITIEIMAGGEPKIEIKGKPLNKDGKPKIQIGVDNPDNPFFKRSQFIKETETKDPWDLDTEGITFQWSTSINEGDPPPYIPSLTLANLGSYIGFEPDANVVLGKDLPAYPVFPESPSDYQMIGRPKTKSKEQMQRVDRLIPTSKLYKDMKDNDETEPYRKQGIKCYIANDGKKTLLVGGKSEIQF